LSGAEVESSGVVDAALSPASADGAGAAFLVPRRLDVFLAAGAGSFDADGAAVSGGGLEEPARLEVPPDSGSEPELEGSGGPAGRLAARRRVRRTGPSDWLADGLVEPSGFGCALDSVVSSLDIHAPQCLRALSAARRRVGRRGRHL
jgi:hypothetical protein